MADLEKKVVLTVGTGDSQQTVKGLKEEINQLRDAVLNLNKDTDEYNDAVAKLQDDQRKLNEVMALTKREAVALDGSYDALAHQMAQLRKEWRATNDEARRNELGKQIDQINDQLKEFDRSIGNYQRNVGNYPDGMEAAAAATRDFGAEMRSAMEAIEPTKQQFESVGMIASGLASGFALVQGAAAALGVENEKLEQTFVKLQAAMAMAQGARGLGDLVEGLGKAKVAFKGLGKVFSGAGGIFAIFAAFVTACIAVVGNLDKIAQWFNKFDGAYKAKKEVSEFNIELNKLASTSAADGVVRLKQLAEGYRDLGDNANEKKKYVEQLKDELADMGIKMNDVNDADNIFINNTENYINALIARAKAEAVKDKAMEDYKKWIEENAELEKQLAEAIANAEAGTPDKTFWQNIMQAILGASVYEGAPVDVVLEVTDNMTAEIAQKNIDAAQAAIDAAKAKADEKLKEAFELIDKYEKEASAYLQTKSKQEQTKIMTKEEALALAAKESAELLEKELEAMNDTIMVADKEKYTFKTGEAEKAANILIGIYEKEAARKKELNEISDADEETKAENEYQINLELLEKKLEILNKYYEEAQTDAESYLALQQQIADAEVDIEKAKYDEKKRLDEQALEDKEELNSKILGVTQQGLQSAGDIMSAIADMYEADGEVTEKEAKKIKGLRIATATMDMLTGIVGALSGLFTTKTGPWDIAMASMQAATIATVGGINIAKIKNTDLTGGSTSTPTMPNPSAYQSDMPFNYTRNITGAQEMEQLNQQQNIKVWISETDLQEANTRVEVRQSESSF